MHNGFPSLGTSVSSGAPPTGLQELRGLDLPGGAVLLLYHPHHCRLWGLRRRYAILQIEWNQMSISNGMELDEMEWADSTSIESRTRFHVRWSYGSWEDFCGFGIIFIVQKYPRWWPLWVFEAFLFPMKNKAGVPIFRHFGLMGRRENTWPVGSCGPWVVWSLLSHSL